MMASHDYNVLELSGFWLYWGPISILIIAFGAWLRQPDG